MGGCSHTSSQTTPTQSSPSPSKTNSLITTSQQQHPQHTRGHLRRIDPSPTHTTTHTPQKPIPSPGLSPIHNHANSKGPHTSMASPHLSPIQQHNPQTPVTPSYLSPIQHPQEQHTPMIPMHLSPIPHAATNSPDTIDRYINNTNNNPVHQDTIARLLASNPLNPNSQQTVPTVVTLNWETATGKKL